MAWKVMPIRPPTKGTSMRYAVALISILTLAPAAVLAQSAPPPAKPLQPAENGPRTARNGLYVELGGAAAIYSVNYERFVEDDVALRIGFGYVGISATGGSSTASVSMVTIPVTASYLGLRSGSHALELGGGAVYVRFSGSVTDSSSPGAFGTASGAVGTAIVGYRYAPVNGGFDFRAAYTPMFSSHRFDSWGGVSFGMLF
jgi:hypothetical protein